MKALTKYLTGAAAAAALTVTAAAPAQAQWGHRYDRDRGIDAEDIITGVAVVGGIAAILGALDNDGLRYGYGNRYRYRDDYRAAVNSCAYEAQRYARGGRVSISQVGRTGRNSYRVRGVVDSGFGGYGYNDGRYDRYDRYSRYDRYDRYNRGGYNQQVVFECDARANGRITDFDIDRRY